MIKAPKPKGQAVGTWHVPTDALGAFDYAGSAFCLGMRLNKATNNIKSGTNR